MANTSSLHLCVGSARNRLPALARISPSPSEESWFPHYKGILHSALLQGRLILSNKTARTVAFFYTLFLHCLVFLVSVWGTGVGTEIKHLLSPPPGAIWAGLSCCAKRECCTCCASGSGGAAGLGSGTRTCQGMSPWAPQGADPTLGGHRLAKGRSWKLAVCSWDQPCVLTQSLVCSQASPLLSGEQTLVNYYQPNAISDFRN